MTATLSAVEQLAQDLREAFIRVIYWDRPSSGPYRIAEYTDFVSNCDSVYLADREVAGVHKSRLVIRQEAWRTDKPNLEIPIEDIRLVEVWRKNPKGAEHSELPLAYWIAPFSRDLERHAAPEV
jgi:hypothetical protein